MHNHEYVLKPSKIYALLWAVVGLGSLGLCISLPLSLYLKVFCMAAVLLYSGWIVGRDVLQLSTSSITAIRYENEHTWFLSTRNHTWQATLRGDSTVTSWLAILRFQVPQRMFPVACVIWRDALTADRYRELRVLLKRC